MSDRRGSVSEGRSSAAEPMENLGARLKRARQKSGLALREVARQLSVSASFISHVENGKSTPSVATLYSMAQLLGVSIDELFTGEAPAGQAPARASDGPVGEDPASIVLPSGGSAVVPNGSVFAGVEPEPISRSDLGSPADAWPRYDQVRPRLSVTRPGGGRRRLEMDTGVIWEQLATNTGPDLDFMCIIYPPHSTSTSGSRMLQHSGSEFGYMVEGELEVTVGFEVVVLRAGDAIGFDSSTPHLLTNRSDVPARGIWVVRNPRD